MDNFACEHSRRRIARLRWLRLDNYLFPWSDVYSTRMLRLCEDVFIVTNFSVINLFCDRKKSMASQEGNNHNMLHVPFMNILGVK